MGCFWCPRLKRKKRRSNKIIPTDSDSQSTTTAATDYSIFSVRGSEGEGSKHGDGPIVTSDTEEGKLLIQKFKAPQNLDLTIIGVQCPRRLSLQQKKEMEEKNVLESLRKEGLTTKITANKSGGLAFEIAKPSKSSAPPPRLEAMVKMRDEKNILTDQQIIDKLFEAERRRKELEEERIVRVRAMQKTETTSTINEYIKRQKALEEIQTKKMDDAVASRQERLRRIRDNLKKKEIHAKAVRRRKEMYWEEQFDF